MRVIGTDGHSLGILQSRDALKMAYDQGLDIVLVTKEANPPVCKIVDFGKFKYDESKKQKQNKQHIQQVKEIKISPRIAEHDIDVQVKKVNAFLADGDKVKVSCVFKQREMAYPEIGKEKINLLLSKINVSYNVEREPQVEKIMYTILAPTKN